MDEFDSLVDDHLDPGSRQALENAHINPSMFSHLRKMFYVVRDPKLLKLGKNAFAVLSNLSATPQDVDQLLQGNFGMNDTEVANLQATAIPHEILSALRARRRSGMHMDIELGFSPTAVAQMRNPSQSQEKAEWDAKVRELMPDFSHQHHETMSSTSLRRLGVTSLTIGVTSVTVSAIIEAA